MPKHPFVALLLLIPLFFVVASCGNLVGVDFGAAHLGADGSIDDSDGGVLLGEGGVCQPKTCAALGFQCGTQNNGCGDAIDCGTCKTGACTGGMCDCVPKTCPEAKADCGKVDNGCGAILDCGACPNASDTCDSQTNTCACKSKTCADQKVECGTVPDGCGSTFACGNNCVGNPNGTICTAGKCGTAACTPKTACDSPMNCGQESDGCSGLLTCGMCASPQTCGGGGVANVCGCTAKTCAQLGANCGAPANGCGGALSCGTCTSPQTCGGGGTADVCGCTPTGTCPVGSNCGTVPNGCGANVACGTACASPNTCGGGGVALHCGCTPLTCADYDCGLNLPNGCGGHINCGTCGGGGGCFAAETPVLMADGSMRPIAELHAGDMIMGYDQATAETLPRRVDRVVIHPPEVSANGIVLINGTIRATRNHPILSGGHAVRAENLRVGDELHAATLRERVISAAKEPIKSVTIIEGGITTYDVKTVPAGGYIVGNKHIIALIKQ